MQGKNNFIHYQIPNRFLSCFPRTMGENFPNTAYHRQSIQQVHDDEEEREAMKRLTQLRL